MDFTELKLIINKLKMKISYPLLRSSANMNKLPGNIYIDSLQNCSFSLNQ